MDTARRPEDHICVVGRCSFQSGIGAVGYAACELLDRHFPVSVYPTEPHLRAQPQIHLPSGRAIPVCRDLSGAQVVFFTDVLWNGAYDHNYLLPPPGAMRIAHVAYDSDELPPQWVKVLNERFDAVLFSSRHLEDIARQCGVEIAVGTLPIGLDIERLLARPYRKPVAGRVRFGSVAAFHPRKGVDALLEAFVEHFGGRDDVELVIHSNLAFGATFEQAKRALEQRGVTNVHLSNAALADEDKNALIETFDVFVNCSRGEGYSIGPREALALGKALVVTDVGGHKDLRGVPGVFTVPATLPMPARYPEIDNLVFGRQFGARVRDVGAALREALEHVRSGQAERTQHARRELGAQFSFTHLSTDYAQVLDARIRAFRTRAPASRFTHLPEPVRRLALDRLGSHLSRLPQRDRTILLAHDGGFFSVFNVFLSHLVWDLQEMRCHLALPDWDVGRMMRRYRTERFTSFCYGRPEDGNVWLKLFEPLYGLSAEQMNDEAFLYAKSNPPAAVWNENREAQLTYTHAYQLYRSKHFGAFRRQYHRVWSDHVRLLPHLQDEIDRFARAHLAGRFLIAAHVKHPSHVIEQPNGVIAHSAVYVEAIFRELAKRGIDPASDGWGVFLATDQDRVVNLFRERFGDRMACFADVRRTRVEEDRLYDSLPEARKRQEGFQVQHLAAADRDSWSPRMAWEVVRDAMTIARCDVLLHVVSNVSTAASYFNPDLELVFCG